MDQNEQRRQETLKRIQEFCLLDDEFMTRCFADDSRCTELVLRIVMEKDDLKVIRSNTQYTVKNLQGRSVRLDVYAIDGNGKEYNIEVQRADNGAGAKRARYNSSLIDANCLLAGDKWEKLPEVYVIFITENDILGNGKPVYHIRRVIEETGEKFKDRSHILYVNAAERSDTPLGMLIHDFSCKNPADMHYKILAERTRYFKENQEGIAVMSRVMEDMLLKERMREKYDTVLRMWNSGKFTSDEIALASGLPVSAVEEIVETQFA